MKDGPVNRQEGTGYMRRERQSVNERLGESIEGLTEMETIESGVAIRSERA